jgi:hypothetical protein
MVTKNQNGQALLEMTLVMSMFILFFLFLQKGMESQKRSFNKWKMGHDTKIEFKKNNQK